MNSPYPCRTQRVTMAIVGLTNGSDDTCQVQQALASVPGVILASINPSTEMAFVAYEPATCALADLVAAVEQTGLHAAPPSAR